MAMTLDYEIASDDADFAAFADDFFSCVHMKSKTIALDYVVVNRKKNDWSVS